MTEIPVSLSHTLATLQNTIWCSQSYNFACYSPTPSSVCHHQLPLICKPTWSAGPSSPKIVFLPQGWKQCSKGNMQLVRSMLSFLVSNEMTRIIISDIIYVGNLLMIKNKFKNAPCHFSQIWGKNLILSKMEVYNWSEPPCAKFWPLVIETVFIK